MCLSIQNLIEFIRFEGVQGMGGEELRKTIDK